MNQEFVQAATALAIEVLKRSPAVGEPWTADEIASAFEEAAIGLLKGLSRTQKEATRLKLETWQRLGA